VNKKLETMKTKKTKIFSSLLLILLIAACGGNGGEDSTSVSNEDTYGGFENAMDMGDGTDDYLLTEQDRVLMNRKLIKTASLSFEVENLKNTSTKIHNAIKKHKAYISSEQEFQSYDRNNVTIDIRVPSKNFEAFLSEVSSDVEYFESKEISALDVTEEYIDVEARIKTKKEVEQQFIALLEKAETINEIMEIQRHIGNVREEIESAEGRLKYLENSTSYSTISLTYYTLIESPSKYGKGFNDSFNDGWDGIVRLFIGLTAMWPFFVLSAIGYMIFRIYRKKAKLKNLDK